MTHPPNLRDWCKPMITTIDRGLAWVRRRFAKPLETGSIPAPVSTPPAQQIGTLGGVLNMMFDAMGGPDAARAEIKSLAYNKAYEPPQPLIWLARHVIWSLKDDRNKWRTEAIEVKKELSRLKRAGNKNEVEHEKEQTSDAARRSSRGQAEKRGHARTAPR